MASVFKPKGKGKYVIFYTDETGRRRKKVGATDKAVTMRIARELENRVALRREGIVDPKAEAYRSQEARPLAEALVEWREAMKARNLTEQHSTLFFDRARRVIAILMGAKLSEIEPGKKVTRANVTRAEAALDRAVGSARLANMTAERVQAALATLRAEGRSLATCNHHRSAIRAFSKWLRDTGKTREDLLRTVAGYNAQEDRRHDRRTLPLDQVRTLIEAAREAPDFQRMTGLARSHCYRLAIATGLRYSELASLTPGSFNLSTGTVTVAAAYTKNGQKATLPVPEDLTADLAAFVAKLAPGDPVFPLPQGKGAKMLRIDLKAAGIAYRDEAGLVFDFHALRCQCATLADAAGVSPRVVQKLMRHSTLELTGRYTRPRAVEIQRAAAMLPRLTPDIRSDAIPPGVAPGPGTPAEGSATRSATRAKHDRRKPRSDKEFGEDGPRSSKP